MAEYDLIHTVSQYFDLHLVLPLLEFMATKDIYDNEDVTTARFRLLLKTSMIDYTIEIWSTISPGKVELSEETLIKRRNEIVSELNELSTKCQKILDAFSDEKTKGHMQNCKDGRQLMAYIMENFDGIDAEIVNDLYALAKSNFDCGRYVLASDLLIVHRMLISNHDPNYLSNLWGKLASNILSQDWLNALTELNTLREYIDNDSFIPPLQSLQQRTWLIHWSLYVYFNHPDGRDYIIDLFLNQPQYLNAIQTLCPHILRYLTAAVVCNRSKQSSIRDVVRVIQQESYQYSDPITEFVEALYVHFDFDGAQRKLRECETVIKNDFFLTACLEDFKENARLAIFETFCRIHECVSIGMLAESLNMKKQEAEIWIVNLIREARLPAKIDYKLGHVVMGTQANEPYQILVEKTRQLAVRTQTQVSNLQQKFVNPDRSQWGNV